MIFHGCLHVHPQMPYLLSMSFVDWLYQIIDIHLPVSQLVLIPYCVSFLQLFSIDFIYNVLLVSNIYDFPSLLYFSVTRTFICSPQKNVKECVLFVHLSFDLFFFYFKSALLFSPLGVGLLLRSHRK